MLTSITPLGERGRGQRWSITAGWLVVGHLLGGAALGAVMAGVGLALGSVPGTIGNIGAGGASDRAVVLAVAAAAAVAATFDLAGGRPPGRRQVDERWLASYRGWVYGVGFGAQLGFGLVTVINTALLGAVLVAGVMLHPFGAVALGIFYGAIRGAAAVANGGVRSVADLHRLHRLLDGTERRVHRVALAAVGAAGLISVAAVLA